METLPIPAPSAVDDETGRISFWLRQIKTQEDFYIFCQDNANYRFEREADGLIIVMPNTGGKTGSLNSEINTDVTIWNRQKKNGRVFDSSTAFHLPDGSTRSPDVAWVGSARWNELSEREQEQFPPICPDFVIELVSASDSLKMARSKMADVWIANGCRLAWLIDPKTETTYIFRANGEIQIVNGFDKVLSGEDVLTGFELELANYTK
ncbi:Uma2 family endonuclease [Larkinella terrae]|uniref:Uma2 family endonuclease n=1 Tax=Larkinella terrae TaxID=2025311 RepID=A0A7K0EF10_9BACT|nr:Uma2 family endonuclease [Larkinella terrae]MRS60161.1 Uma2 family endonuclease [Larkinella terrae]